MDLSELTDLAAAMRASGVVRYRSGGLEIQLHPSAFAAAPPAEPVNAAADGDACACGHSLVTDHNPQGCLHGCDVATCNTTR
jgi:hypothetical protein